jgi:transposase-like protein
MPEWLGPAILERLWRLTLTEVGLLLVVCAICIYGHRLLGELRKANDTLRALRRLEDRHLARTERALLSADLDHRGEPLAHDVPPQGLEGVMGPRKSDSRRAFTVKFKRSVVQQIMKGEKSLAEISRELNIQPRVVRQWQRRFDVGTNIPAAAPKDVVREAHQAEELAIPDKFRGVGGQARGA